MLIYRRTSIFESPAQTLVNTVNCVGVMGKGLAQAFRDREPAMFAAYKRICDQKALVPGKLWLWRGRGSWVLNFPTKMHWRNPSKIEWIEQGLAKFVSAYEAQGITEISFPLLGCGNGGLDWSDVRPVMEHYLSQVSIPVYIHDHTVDVGLPEHLEAVAVALRSEKATTTSFDSFMASIGKAVDLSNGKLETLDARSTFAAHMRDDRGLAIETDTREASSGDEAELRARGALADAAEALRFGQAQHAARNAAAAIAWAVKAAADRELAAALRAGQSPQAAARAAGSSSLGLWQGAAVAFRRVAAPEPAASVQSAHLVAVV